MSPPDEMHTHLDSMSAQELMHLIAMANTAREAKLADAKDDLVLKLRNHAGAVAATFFQDCADIGLDPKTLQAHEYRALMALKSLSGYDVKYTSKDGSHVWSGRGTPPHWFRNLLAEGYEPEELMV
jgi:DNA-binding protein H-NS